MIQPELRAQFRSLHLDSKHTWDVAAGFQVLNWSTVGTGDHSPEGCQMEKCPRERGDSKVSERSGHRQPAPNCQAHWYFFFLKIIRIYLFIGCAACGNLGSQNRDWTCALCSGVWRYNHWTTEAVPRISISCSGQGRPRARQPEGGTKQPSPLVSFAERTPRQWLLSWSGHRSDLTTGTWQ